MTSLEQLLRSAEALQEKAGLPGKSFAASMPVVVWEDGARVERIFFYPQTPQPCRQRPLAWMEWKDGAPVHFTLCKDRDFMDSSRFPLEGTVDYSLPAPCGAMEQIRRLRRLRELYEKVRELPWDRPLEREEGETVREYARVLAEGTPPGLMPYYEGLGGAFFAWMERQSL